MCYGYDVFMEKNEQSDVAVYFSKLHVKRGQTQILNDITLSFSRGKYTAILGANGLWEDDVGAMYYGACFVDEWDGGCFGASDWWG